MLNVYRHQAEQQELQRGDATLHEQGGLTRVRGLRGVRGTSQKRAPCAIAFLTGL